MFKNYEIKNFAKEDILIIYLDMETEFATLNRNKKTTINKEINDYIKNKNIKFNGHKIILMAGSVLIGAFLYTRPLLNKNETHYNYATNIITMSEPLNIKKEEITNKPDIKENKKEEEAINKQKEKVEVKKQNNIISNQSIKKEEVKKTEVKKPNNITTSKNNVSTPTTPKKVENKNNETQSKIESVKKDEKTETTINKEPSKDENLKIEDPKKENTVEKKVTIKRSNGSVVTLELEEYIIGVVSAEMPASFHIEALKAQSVAARTYALKTISDGKTLTDTTSTQVYQDNNQLKNKWGSSYDTYYNKIKNAVLATKGLVMTYNGSLINAYYHSTSNGYTEDSTAVFGAYPYLKSIASPVDTKVSSYLKTIAMSYQDISNKLGIPVTNLSTVSIQKNNSNRIDKIIIDNNVYGGVEFRTKLGLRSTDFDLNLNENNISITTRGYGHGVGMSQYGAHEYAKTGMSYQNILKHYYTGINITQYKN